MLLDGPQPTACKCSWVDLVDQLSRLQPCQGALRGTRAGF